MSYLPIDNDTKKYPSKDPSLILSVSDKAFELPQVLPGDLTVFSETLGITAKIYTGLTGKNYRPVNVVLCTNRLIVNDGSNNIGIDLSGPDASKTEVDGKIEVDDGRKGGSIQLFVEDTSMKTFGLYLRAHGGRGYDGIGNEDGTNGGDAGQVKVFYRSIYGKALALLVNIYEAYTSNTLPTQESLLHDFSSLVGGNEDLKVLGTPVVSFDKFGDLAGLAPSRVGEALLIGIAKSLYTAENSMAAKIYGRIDTSGGNYGTRGSATAKNGISGKATIPVVTAWADSIEQCSWTISFTHPVQCRMVLEKAKLKYFIGGDGSLGEALLSLQRLTDRLAFVDAIKSDSPLRKIFAESAVSLFLLDPAGDGQAVIDGFTAIRNEAQSYLDQLNKGLDFYGNGPRYVPRGSYVTYMKGDVDNDVIWKTLFILEKTYSAYMNAEEDYDARLSHVQDVVSSCIDKVQTNNDYIAYIKDEARLDLVKIASSTPPIQAQLDQLIQALDDAKEAVVDSFHIPTRDILEALGQCIMVPEVAMRLVQGTSVVYSGATKLPSDDDETTINKDYLIRKMQVIIGETDDEIRENLKEGYKLLKAGTIEQTDPGAEKLLIAERDMNALLSDYSKAIGDGKAAQVKEGFRQYAEAVQEQNRKIAHYDACIRKWAQLEQENEDLDSQATMLSEENLNDTTIDFPAVNAFMERMYVSALADAMWQLYQGQRAFQFASLSTEDIIAETLGTFPLSRMNYAVLSGVRGKIVRKYLDAVEAQGKPKQSFTPLRYHISPANLYLLKYGGIPITVTIPEAIPSTTTAESVFHGMGNVRLTKVRFYAVGATTEDDFLFIRLEHGGSERIVRNDGFVVPFEHSQLAVDFRYKISDPAFRGGGTIEGDIGEISKDEYSLVGPFATWSVQISGDQNQGLSFEGVTDAYFEFEGQFDAF